MCTQTCGGSVTSLNTVVLENVQVYTVAQKSIYTLCKWAVGLDRKAVEQQNLQCISKNEMKILKTVYKKKKKKKLKTAS